MPVVVLVAAVPQIGLAAGQGVTLLDPYQNNYPIGTTANPLVVSTGLGPGSNVTIVGPIGTGAPAVGVTTTLDTTDAAALQSLVAGLCASPCPVVPTPSASSSYGIPPVNSASAEACHVLKASAGNLYSVSGVIGAAGYIMVFNATSAPADGAVTPVAWAYAGAQGSWSMQWSPTPLYLGTGITVCMSSTGPFSKTAYSTNSAISGQAQ